MFGRIGKLPHERVTLAWNLECARRVPTCREGDGAFAVGLQFEPYVLVVSNDLFTESIQSAVSARQVGTLRAHSKCDCDKLIAPQPGRDFDRQASHVSF